MIGRLSIVPVAVSYELDPCDELKARELAALAKDGVYRKSPGEDLRSIITGVTGRKGRVHLTVGPAFSSAFSDADSVAAEIDRQIARRLPVVSDPLRRLRGSPGSNCKQPVDEFRCACRVRTRLAIDAGRSARADHRAVRKSGGAGAATRTDRLARFASQATTVPAAVRRALQVVRAGAARAPTSTACCRTPEIPAETPDRANAARSTPRGA